MGSNRSGPVRQDITEILRDVSRGDREAVDRLLPLVYDDLRELARRELRREHPDHTLAPTELVHESYLRLARLRRLDWRDRSHFFGAAAGTMRRILVDHARRRAAEKRGGGAPHLPLDNVVLAARERPDDLLALDEALSRLEALDPRQARVVECRFFAGMSVEETGRALGLSPATVKRDWAAARAWLNRELTA